MGYPKSKWRDKREIAYCMKCGKVLDRIYQPSTYNLDTGEEEKHWRSVCPDFKEWGIYGLIYGNNGHTYLWADDEYLMDGI